MAKEIGFISFMSGTVLIKTPDGKVREAKVGETVREGDVIMGTARISMFDGSNGIDVSGNVLLDQSVFTGNVPTAKEAAIQPETQDVIVQALERGQDLNQTLDATAAGLGAGGEGGGSSFVVLARILENVVGNSYRYGYDPLGIPEVVEGVGPVQVAAGTTTTTTVTEDPKTPDTPNDPKDPPKDDPEEPEEPEDPEEPEEPEDPEDPEDEDDEKEHKDNGKGNGVDDAPGNSGDTKGDDADGSNTPGTIDTDVIPMPVDRGPKGNNGWGNGDQDAPGNSLENNNAENSEANNPLDHKDVLVDTGPDLFPGNSGNSSGNNNSSVYLDDSNELSKLLKDLHSNNGHNT